MSNERAQRKMLENLGHLKRKPIFPSVVLGHLFMRKYRLNREQRSQVIWSTRGSCRFEDVEKVPTSKTVMDIAQQRNCPPICEGLLRGGGCRRGLFNSFLSQLRLFFRLRGLVGGGESCGLGLATASLALALSSIGRNQVLQAAQGRLEPGDKGRWPFMASSSHGRETHPHNRSTPSREGCDSVHPKPQAPYQDGRFAIIILITLKMLFALIIVHTGLCRKCKGVFTR